MKSDPKLKPIRKSFKGGRRPRRESKKSKSKVQISVYDQHESDDEGLTAQQKLMKETFNFNPNIDKESYREILDFSPGRQKNRWRFIYNSLFNKKHDKRILMKKFLDCHRKAQLKKSYHRTPAKKKTRTTILNTSNYDENVSHTIRPNPPGQENSLENFRAVKQMSAMREKIHELSKDFEQNQIKEVKKLIGIKTAPKSLRSSTQVHFQQVFDFLFHNGISKTVMKEEITLV